MADEARAASSPGLDELGRAQIAAVVKEQLADFRLGDLRDAVHDAGVKIEVMDDKVKTVHRVLIDDGAKDTIVSKMNALLAAEEKRTIAETELRAMRRQITAAVIISMLLSAGTLVWQALK